MNRTLVIFDFDYLHGASISTSSTCATSFVHIYNWLNSGNSLLMDCRCFCNIQEAIDIIERRVIPSDSEAGSATFCGETFFAIIIGIIAYLHNQALISDISSKRGIVANCFYTLLWMKNRNISYRMRYGTTKT